MKDAILKGHPLTEKEMHEVLGGTVIVCLNPPTEWVCDDCGATLNDFHHEENGPYVSMCPVCGSIIKKQIEE